MAQASASVSTVLLNPPANQTAAAPPTLKLRLQKPEKKGVSWTETTVDNEHLNKKKSKCCCIYKKPRAFDESSSESEGEDDHNALEHKSDKSQCC